MNKTVLLLYPFFFFCISIGAYFAIYIYIKYREVFLFSLFVGCEINRSFPVNGDEISFISKIKFIFI